MGTLDEKPLRGNVNRFPLPAPAPIPVNPLKLALRAWPPNGSGGAAQLVDNIAISVREEANNTNNLFQEFNRLLIDLELFMTKHIFY